jgi:hypothetical protein
MRTQEELASLVRDIHRRAQRSAVLAAEAAVLAQEAEELLAVAADRRAAALDAVPPYRPH